MKYFAKKKENEKQKNKYQPYVSYVYVLGL